MNLIEKLVAYKILQPNERVQAHVNGTLIEGEIVSSYEILVNNQLFDSFDSATQAVLADNDIKHPTSGAKFWNWYSDNREAWVPIEHARAQLDLVHQKSEVKTSTSHPLRIDFVTPSNCEGRIGMTICPGKQGAGLYGGEWQRDLYLDMNQIIGWGCSRLITLLEDREFELLGVPEFANVMCDYDINWVHLPIRDMRIPDQAFENRWATLLTQIIEDLRSGSHIVVHCRGGLGRTGIVAARILVEMGEAPSSAVARIRNSRAQAIETFEQEEYILNRGWGKYT